jgi:hypothetical protein
MAEPMPLLGVGARFSILARVATLLGGRLLGGLMLGGLVLGSSIGCSSSEGGAKSDGAEPASESASVEGKSSEPEQVVRQMKAAPEPSVVAGGVLARQAAAGEAVTSEARAPRSNSAETITSKHLEAELNRLEAELAN